MSVTFNGYLIDLSQLESRFGSRNHSVLQQVREKFLQTPDFRPEILEADAGAGATVAETIQKLVDGDVTSLEEVPILNAVSCLILAFGKSLHNEIFCGVRYGFVDVLGQGAKALFEGGLPFRIAQFDLKEELGHLRNSEVAAHLAEINARIDAVDSPIDGDVMDGLVTLIDWYEAALDAHKDLVGICET